MRISIRDGIVAVFAMLLINRASFFGLPREGQSRDIKFGKIRALFVNFLNIRF